MGTGIEAILKFSCSFCDLSLKLDQMRSKIHQWDFTMNKCVFIDVRIQEGILYLLANTLFWIIHKDFTPAITEQVLEAFQIKNCYKLPKHRTTFRYYTGKKKIFFAKLMLLLVEMKKY